ncbi:hypothetical protein [Acinetobacter courvalinii]|uniref:hypothetical protein n=1 Tax=Acinetobacter courvalinii TaxID=280147 RepID=UPI0002CF2C4B|nr:hypothetical protein [Acinetobacter courvalinii]ENX05927.1 hypothetical protein F898_02871 [Acinetobacter courvalinii]
MSFFQLSQLEIESLISGDSISEVFPWSTNNENLIVQHYKQIFLDISKLSGTQFLVDFDHYGSGYASYIPTFFFKEEFRTKQLYPPYNQNFLGLEIYFCRIAPYFIMIEKEYRWQSKTRKIERFNGFPELDQIDEIKNSNLILIAQQIEKLLSKFELIRLNQKQLKIKLPSNYEVHTNFTNHGYCYFDAFFHWED